MLLQKKRDFMNWNFPFVTFQEREGFIDPFISYLNLLSTLSYLKTQYLSETKYSSETEMYRKVVTMKSSLKFSYKTPLSQMSSLNGEIINQSIEIGILHGSEIAPFVYTLYSKYSDI